MINKIYQAFISMKVMIVLTIIFAFSSAAATFIENDYGIETAWALVYGATWFEVLQVALGLNLLGNLFKFKMFQLKKLPVLIFHVGFLFVLVGAAITRYIGYEGIMHIREGTTVNRMLSADSLIQIRALKDNKEYYSEKKVLISKIGGNDFTATLDVDGKEIEVKFKKLIQHATKAAVSDENGKPIVSIVVTTPYGPEEYFIRDKSHIDTGVFEVYLNKQPSGNKDYIHIYQKDGKFYFKSNIDIDWFVMATNQQGVFKANTEYEFKPKMLYTVKGFRVVPKAVLEKGTLKVVSSGKQSGEMQMRGANDLSALVVDVTYDGVQKEVALMGQGKNFRGYTENFKIKDTYISLEWGSKEIILPFSLHLKDFIMEKYPGSMSPSSYESDVILLDEKNGVNMPYKIYMNHTLEYAGYKFFQSSYDKDERGTILSVNNDPGKWPTYIGYFLLGVGFFFNMLNPHSRFGKLSRTRYEIPANTAKASIFILFLTLFFNAKPAIAYGGVQQEITPKEIIETIKKVDLEHANKFGTLVIQGADGRMKPMDTVAINVLNKIYGKTSIFGLNHNQVLLGMSYMPSYWRKIKMIKVSHPEVKKIFGIAASEKYIAFDDIFDEKGVYKLAKYAEDAQRKKPSSRDKFDKDVLKVDERLNIAYMVFFGELLRIFPLKDHPNDKWHTPQDAIKTFPIDQRNEIMRILQKNFQGINEGIFKNDWKLANEAIDEIKKFQILNSPPEIIPSQNRINMEILYNKLDLFNRLIPVYLLAGFTLLILIFIRLFKPSLDISIWIKLVLIVLILGFIAHTFNLALRWYVATHAPWSNGYEAMLYISWSIILAGILFSKQSEFALSTTAIFAGLTLFVAHLSWLDPQITTLVPVLKSYWLTIHVAVITASYGFLGLSALLGFISLILFSTFRFLKDSATKQRVTLSIKEATRINELSMIAGISLLTVGNFLGGVWANESWGRYWGWDPKETWTLITILIYTAVLHFRFVPALNSVYLFCVASLLSFSSVIMTYFGVNYYLSGLHSYAGGDPLPIPPWVSYVVATVAALIVLSYFGKDEIKKYKIKSINIRTKRVS